MADHQSYTGHRGTGQEPRAYSCAAEADLCHRRPPAHGLSAEDQDPQMLCLIEELSKI